MPSLGRCVTGHLMSPFIFMTTYKLLLLFYTSCTRYICKYCTNSWQILCFNKDKSREKLHNCTTAKYLHTWTHGLCYLFKKYEIENILNIPNRLQTGAISINPWLSLTINLSLYSLPESGCNLLTG